MVIIIGTVWATLAFAHTSPAAAVCFSPDGPCADNLLRFVGGAKSSIDMAIYDINLKDLVKILILKAKHMRVRIVVDKRQSHERYSLVSNLESAGVKVRYGHQRGIMHDKFTIVDDKMIETGSFNYTNHATKANQENQIYLSDPNVVKRYEKQFQKIWETAKPSQ